MIAGTTGAVTVTFSARRDALEPACVVGAGPTGRALAVRLLDEGDAALGQLRGVASGDVLVILGAAASLPWVDGARYLGRDPRAPLLLLPTDVRPDVPVDALERALVRRAPSARPPLALLLAPRRVVSVAFALPLSRPHLRAWLEAR